MSRVIRAVASMVLLLLFARPSFAATIERSRYLMGTSLSLTLVGDDPAALEAAATRAYEEAARIEGSLSNWKPESEVSRLNAAGGRETRLGDDLFRVVDRGLDWARETDGAFDPAIDPLVRAYDLRGNGRVPSEEEVASARVASRWTNVHLDRGARTVRLEAGAGIETGGIGKGYALDQAAQVLRAAGVRSALLNFGGQMLAMGAPPGESGWTVQLADANDRSRPTMTLVLRDASLATSSQAERGMHVGHRFIGHVIDPSDGAPVATRGSAGAIAGTGIDADALSTALLVLGPSRGARFVERYNARASDPFEAIFLAPDASPLRVGGVAPSTVALAQAQGSQAAVTPAPTP